MSLMQRRRSATVEERIQDQADFREKIAFEISYTVSLDMRDYAEELGNCHGEFANKSMHFVFMTIKARCPSSCLRLWDHGSRR